MKNTATHKSSVTGLLKASALLLISASLIVVSCKKDTSNDDPAPGVQNTTSTTSSTGATTSTTSTTSTTNPAPVVTKTDLLTAKTWKLSAAIISPAMMGEDDMYAMMGDCEKDNTIKFNADKTSVMDEGASKCNMMDPQTKAGSWSFNGDETKLMMDTKENTLLDLTASQLKTSYTMSMGGETYTITMTYSGQ